MPAAIDDQVIDFYQNLFDHMFSEPFRPLIPERRRRNAVEREINSAADAASQSLTRFFLNQQLDDECVAQVLDGLSAATVSLHREDVSNPNLSPESIIGGLLGDCACPKTLVDADREAIYRVTLHSVVQVLMLIGPVMTEWRKLGFASTYELLRRVVDRLNQISEQMDVLGRSGQSAADERYELTYRDYLFQRFHRVEAGTVTMTANLNVDVRELFVVPNVRVRISAAKPQSDRDDCTLMDLARARRLFGGESLGHVVAAEETPPVPALEQVRLQPRNVIVGIPGSGKSTLADWLQICVAGAEEPLVLRGQQAIPLLLRVRHLDPLDLPGGSALIEKATASQYHARLMPAGWIERQMAAGRVLFMLDGLDEVEPELRDRYVLPWLRGLCRQYPDCFYVVSSRPVGYVTGALKDDGFTECELQDFDDEQVGEYCRHWCTSVRLARNESSEEARAEGARDGQQIVTGFVEHPHTRNLARNPLMLSAICLVNYFEGGQLPRDRAVLYRLCVEGLLHHWDRRRGIHSDFTLDEKLRTCREVALAMQADDRAEYEADRVRTIFSDVLRHASRAEALLEHIRYRTGLLLERRPGIFAFAHLTFQEYLAAQAVLEGNRLGIHDQWLARQHPDGRWNEVIALFCGSASAPTARRMIELLVEQPDSAVLGQVLTEAYLAANCQVTQDAELRRRVIARVASAPERTQVGDKCTLDRFPDAEVAPLANEYLGVAHNELGLTTAAYRWLFLHRTCIDWHAVAPRITTDNHRNSTQVAELMHLAHSWGPPWVLADVTARPELYAMAGPKLETRSYTMQSEVALLGLVTRWRNQDETPASMAALTVILNSLTASEPDTLSDLTPGLLKQALSRASKYCQRDEVGGCTWRDLRDAAHKLLEQWRRSRSFPRSSYLTVFELLENLGTRPDMGCGH
jgi:hypothetical protein